jgi:hypothetical protein
MARACAGVVPDAVHSTSGLLAGSGRGFPGLTIIDDKGNGFFRGLNLG